MPRHQCSDALEYQDSAAQRHSIVVVALWLVVGVSLALLLVAGGIMGVGHLREEAQALVGKRELKE